ncbi:uncharacterized protein LOC132721668 [Ruditapes philippinarum]|uniref:uncharacterized protein LOC132721668 n=1 Tax=Ruditapes philippinarum TaxID=129788 RepID=UPI00295B7BBB|nr:uncharacterized protein LOC132721668 [Ruditapes philippinarum]
MAGYSSLGKDFPFADEVNPEDGACHAERRDVDKATTSLDSNIRDNIEEVWKKLEFKVLDDRNTVYKKDATKQVNISMLQYAFKSEVAKIDFLRRIEGGYEFEVESPGVVHVSGECFDKNKIDELWVKLISSINDALTQRNVVTSYKFRSRTEMENTLQKLDRKTKHLTESGIIGIFTSYEDNVCIAKFVAAQPDLDKFIPKLHLSMASGKNATFGHLKKVEEYHKKNVRVDSIDILEDEDKYFQTMDYLVHLRGKFPHVRITREDTDSATYKFICVDEHELMEAMSWFHSCINEMERKMVDVSPDGFKFISKNKNVQAYLEIRLRKVQSALMIYSDKIYVLCQEKYLETSERIVIDNIKTVELEGCLFPEAEEIQKNCHGKIQVFKGNKPGMMIIWYTVDKSVEAKKLIDLVQKYRKYKRKPYSDKEIKEMKALGVMEELQEEYKDILIRTGDTDVILQGPEMDQLDACFKKLDTALQKIDFVELNSLPNLQQKLLQNGKVQKYVAEKLKRKTAICEDAKAVTGFVFRKENEKSKSSIYLEIKNCFVEMKIDTQCLEHEKGKSFLSEHPEEVVIGDQRNKTFCSICCTADLSQEIRLLLYSYSKSCTPIVANYLLSFGAKCLEEIKEKHKVGIEIENDRICIKGQYSRGKNVVTEIESHLNTTVLHFGKLDYKRKQLLAADKNQIDSVAENCRCCLKAEVFPFQSIQTEEKGIEYLCTWNLPCRKEQISIAKIDYNTAKLDGLIVPVNECLYGEDINGKDERHYSPDQSHQPKLRIGDSEEMVWENECVSVKCFALVTSESGLSQNKQTRQNINASDLKRFCFAIFEKMFSERTYKVGFELPTRDPNLIGKLDAVIEAFQDIKTTHVYHSMSDPKLIFGVKTEAERWMKEVDDTLKYTPNARRIISPRYKGLLNSPCTSVEIAKKSILETGANCIVVAISQDLDLSKGFVSNLVSKACGKQLKAELSSKCKKPPKFWDLVMCQSYNLAEKGIQKVIFGYIPCWKDCNKIEDLEVFVQNCLLLADSEGISTLAFPALGTGKEYPYRDVAVALLNGVDKYVAEGIIGGISTVYISVPQITKKEVEICQILDREQERRKSAETTSGKQHQAEGNI